MKKILYFLFFLLISISPVSAWEETFEGHWYDLPNTNYTLGTGLHLTSFQDGTAVYNPDSTWHALTIYTNYTGYCVFTIHPVSNPGTLSIYLEDSTGAEVYRLYNASSWVPTGNTTIEIIQATDKSSVSLYANGALIYTAAKLLSTDVTRIYAFFGASGGVYVDDFSSNYCCIGQKGFFSSTNNQAYFIATSPNTTGYMYHMQISADNGVSLKQWNLTSRRSIGSISLVADLNGDGLYYSEIYGQDGQLYYSKPFLYYSGGVFPDNYFVVDTDTAADIRDEDYNGGAVTGGGTVYLYPQTKADGHYNFSCAFSESAYSREISFSKIYNYTTVIGSIFTFSGLQSLSYNVSVDGVAVGKTNNSDVYEHPVNWVGNNTYEFTFEPDFSIPGIWGYVKNSETQAGVKSAHVTISNDTFSTTLDTDINGMYYYTSGIVANESYTVTVTKSGYTAPASQTVTTKEGLTTRQDFFLDQISTDGSGLYYAPHDVGFTVLEYWYSGAGLPGVSYTISSEDDGEIKTGTTDSKGMFTGSDMTGGTNYTITLTYNGKTYTEYVEPSLTEYTFVLNKEGVLHQYANSWLTLSYTENTNNVTIAYESNKSITGASLTAIANNGTTVYSQTLTTDTGSFTFETGGEGDYTLNFHIQATDGDTASQSWGLSYPSKVPLFPDEYPAWLKNVIFSGIVIVFLLSFGKAKNDIACGAVAILTSMGYIFEWFTCPFYFVVLIWIIALGAVFIHYKRTGGIG